MLSVCVPVLKRYDLLRKLLVSAQAGTVVPNKYVIINNGRNVKMLEDAIGGVFAQFEV